MMLWWKAWRESRTRFLISAATIAGLCAAFVFFARGRATIDGTPITYLEYIWRLVYKGYLREMFDLLVIFLAAGGILRERDYGTAWFTLALPITRKRLVSVRAAVGIAQTAVLAFLPAIVIAGLSPLAGEHYSWTQAIQFAFLWAVGGAFIFVIGFLSSVCLAGEYTAPIAAILGLLAYSAVADVSSVERYALNVHDMMSGSETTFFRRADFVFMGPLPWTALAVIVLVVLSSVALALRIAQRQDF